MLAVADLQGLTVTCMITHLAVSHPCVFSSQLCHAVQRFGTLLDDIKLPGKELKDIYFIYYVYMYMCLQLMRFRRTNRHILFQQHTLFHPAPDLDSKSQILVDS